VTRRWLRVACALVLCGAAAAARAEEEEEEEDLRERLTEREDKRRPVEPFTLDLGGRPLVLGGEYELKLDFLRNFAIGDVADDHDRLLLEQGAELEAFYSFGKPLSLFAQVIPTQEQDLLPGAVDDVSDLYVERGEMWLASEDIAGSGVSFDVGHLDFEDDRLWWWDEELDGARVGYEHGAFSVEATIARELLPERSDKGYVDPDHEGVLRFLGEASWDWGVGHAVDLFFVHQDDRSQTERPGDVVRTRREDDSDARLTWLGLRLMGITVLPSQAAFGYWLDGAWVFGRERVLEFEEITRGRSVVEARNSRDVGGFAVDAGVIVILPLPAEPRAYLGYAFGSGDSSQGEGNDGSFHQTGLQGNESGFGGVERFSHYGVALDPELSNLSIPTIGVGFSLLRSSSLDLVYHHYRLVEHADALRDARLEFELNGESRELGDEIDVVLALEEWERLEFEFVGAAFRASQAFGRARDAWSYGGFAAVRYAF
jgi:hypothetical protein